MHRFGVVIAMVTVLTVQGCFKSENTTEKTAAVSSVQRASVSSLTSPCSSLAAMPSVALSVGLDELPEGNATEAAVTVTYSDGKTKEIPFGFQWKIGNPNIVTADGTRLKAKAEGTTTVQAVVNGKCSPAKRITVYKLIHGHRLPPEPDPKINNATLLGIDSNRNGVRDDVERWIYMTYEHLVERGLFMQSARAYQKVIVDPSKAFEIKVIIENAVRCESYWSMDNEKMKLRNLSYTFGEYRSLEDEIKQIQFNTLERHISFEKFNGTLSGGVYPDDAQPYDWNKSCEFEKNGFLRIENPHQP